MTLKNGTLIQNERLDRILYINRTCFKIAFLVTMMFTAIPFVHGIISPYIKLLLLWGGASVGADLLTGARLIRNKFTGLLIAFCGAYAVTILLNREAYFGDNVKALLYMGVIFVMLYGQDLSLDKETVKKEMRLVSYVFVSVSFALSLACFATYVFSIDTHYTTDEGWKYIGMFENRLWGLYNPNTGSTIATLSMVLTVFLWMTRGKKSKLLTAFYIINLCIQSFCLILTGSRTALYVLYIGVAMLVFYLLPLKWFKTRSLKNYLLRGVAAALAVVCVMLSFQVVRYALSYVPSLTKSIISMSTDGEKVEIEKEELDRLEEKENREGGFLTGRQHLWEAGFDAFLESPIFGVTRENISDRAKVYLVSEGWEGTLSTGGLHNIYLTILTASGIVGFVLMGGFAVWSIIKMFIALYKKKFAGKGRYCFLFSFVLIALFFVMELFEARILYRVSLFYVFFWIYYGYAMYFTQKAECDTKEIE